MMTVPLKNTVRIFIQLCKDIYPTQLELKKENNSNSCASFLDLYIYIENGEFYTRLFDK